VFARQEVAEFVLDLRGYTPGLLLHRLLKPSFGEAVSSSPWCGGF
jgi:hypothetical protein